MLTDAYPVDRAHRTFDLLRSEVPEEREVAAREIETLLNAPGAQQQLREAFYTATEAAAHDDAQDVPLDLPDTEWRFWQNRWGGIVAARRLRGRTLVLRESGSRRGWFYPVVDGHHPSAHGAPWAYPTLAEAAAAAEGQQNRAQNRGC